MSCFIDHVSIIKKKLKKAFVPVVAGVGAVVASASTASAAIDFTAVQTDITAAVADILAGGAILLAAYAGFWGIKKVISLFSHG